VGSSKMLRSLAAALWSFWRRGAVAERAGYVVGGLLVSSGLVHLAILVIGGGSWEGPVSLRKAATFGLSFGLTLVTIVWVTTWVRMRKRSRAALLGVFTLACTLETVLVSLQTWRGVPSHFNIQTPFDSLVARTLAAGGAMLIIVILTFLVTAFRDNPAVPRSLLVATRVGLLTLSTSLMVGALMIAKGMRLVLAGDATGAYATGGTFKPTHAATMHAVLILPGLAWLLSFADWPEARRIRVVIVGSASYLLVAAVVAIQNFQGRNPWDGAVAAGLLLAGIIGLIWSAAVAIAGVAHAFTDRPGG
jgi:hypothetical protein